MLCYNGAVCALVLYQLAYGRLLHIGRCDQYRPSNTEIAGALVKSAQFGTNTDLAVGVEVVQSAQTGFLFLSGNTNGMNGALNSSMTVEIAGNLGVQSVSFVSGTALSAVVAAVNTLRETTGVSASMADVADQSSGMVFNSIDFGADEFVSVRTLSGGDDFQVFDARGGDATDRDMGRNVSAVVNGVLAVGDGLNVSLNTTALSVDLDLTQAFATSAPGATSAFRITGGGAMFQIGPNISSSQSVGVGIQSVAASRIGGTELDGERYFLKLPQERKWQRAACWELRRLQRGAGQSDQRNFSASWSAGSV